MTGINIESESGDQIRPILRWAGSKFRLLKVLSRAAPVSYRRYFEPFAGSACLFLRLEPGTAVLGDINEHLIDTYRTIRRAPAAVHGLFFALPRTKDMYYRLRAIEPRTLSAVERAARFVYLNQFCFNGVYRENRQGQFNVPRGRKFRAPPTEDVFLEVAERLQSADLRRGDFTRTLSDVQRGDFVYLDPPYAKAGARNRGEYGKAAFTADDVARLVDVAKVLDGAGAYVMISFFDSARLRRHLTGWHITGLNVARSVAGFTGKRRAVRELMAINYESVAGG